MRVAPGPPRPRLGWQDFARGLLDTDDLDPVYVVVNGAGLARPRLLRWLLSYWCFYHVGTACHIVSHSATSEGAYWDMMMRAAGSKEYPRCTERRHFRGAQATEAVAWLSARGVDALWAPLLAGPHTARAIIAEVSRWRRFGPWISFKAADMLERLGLCEVSFDGASAFMFDSPRQGAAALASVERPGWQAPPEQVQEWAVGRVLASLGTYTAPPRHERPLNVQEAETILCKWKSHLGGHYEVGDDIRHTREALLWCGTSRPGLCAAGMSAAGRTAKLWS